MRNNYFIDYLKNIPSADGDFIDLMSCELDKIIYYYGEQFKSPRERGPRNNYWIMRSIREWCGFYKMMLAKKPDLKGKTAISNAYFSYNDELKNIGLNVFVPPWRVGSVGENLPSMGLYRKISLMSKCLNEKDFNYLISRGFCSKVNELQNDIVEYLLKNDVAALFVPSDMFFYEKLSIDIFKQLRKPSFVMLHGLPARYNDIDDNRADYLVVWGEKIKEYYIGAGVDPQKIYVSGHPSFKIFNSGVLKNSLENVLVITKAMNGAQPDSTCVVLSDRGNLIQYLYSIQNILKKLGVVSARFRPHPSENGAWYLKYVDNDFYELDRDSLNESLLKSSLVIGPTSTVLLDAVYSGVNYQVYEPSANNIDLINLKLVPPFDGSEKRVPVAKSEAQLLDQLKGNSAIDPEFFKDYVKTPFDIKFINSLI